MAAQGKKKMKGKTINLTEFLSDEKGGSPAPTYSSNKIDWAAEMDSNDLEDLDLDLQRSMIDRSKLPTAPKAARGPDVDLGRIPNQPPYTAFIGNLPYEATEDLIENFFKNLKVVNVRLPTDQGRLRGFGYVEFEDRQSLIDALGLNDENMGGRKMRVDLAGQNQNENQKSGFGDRRNEGPDRTDSDWRRGPPPESDFDRNDRRGGGSDRWGGGRGFEDRGSRGYDRDDRGPSRGFDRDDRGPSRGFDRDDRGPSRGFDRDDRGPSRGFDRDERGPSRGFDRDDRGPRGYDRGDRGYDRDRGGFDRSGGPRDDWNSRRDFDDRGPSRGFDRDGGRGYRDRGFESGGDRGYDRRSRDRYDDRDRGYGSGFRRDDRRDDGYDRPRSDRPRSPEGGRDAPVERPRLNLQPRTKPVENEGPKNPGSAPEKKASIFGAAKPVDTAAREREIEERLAKQRLEESKRAEEGKDEPKSPLSPVHREDPVKLVPAPPPPVNAWNKRKVETAQKPGNPGDGKSPPQSNSQVPAKSETKSNPTSAEPPATNAWAKGKPADLRSSESAWNNLPPKEERGGFPGEGRGGSSRGGRGRGTPTRGRGGKQKVPREKPIPKSIDEMPKFEEKEKKVWTDANKFAGLISDEDVENED
uniref:RRM domain-containing protein n=1 Tax=Magallana gigas TaxID=29159 RepID=A0A8W8MZQ2_MAGGI